MTRGGRPAGMSDHDRYIEICEQIRALFEEHGEIRRRNLCPVCHGEPPIQEDGVRWCSPCIGLGTKFPDEDSSQGAG